MNTKEKQSLGADYQKAIEELQGLYDGLFYEELKRRIASIEASFGNLQELVAKESKEARNLTHFASNELKAAAEELQAGTIDEVNSLFGKLYGALLNDHNAQMAKMDAQFAERSDSIHTLSKDIESLRGEVVSGTEGLRNEVAADAELVRSEVAAAAESLKSEMITGREHVHSAIALGNEHLQAEMRSGFENVQEGAQASEMLVRSEISSFLENVMSAVHETRKELETALGRLDKKTGALSENVSRESGVAIEIIMAKMQEAKLSIEGNMQQIIRLSGAVTELKKAEESAQEEWKSEFFRLREDLAKEREKAQKQLDLDLQNLQKESKTSLANVNTMVEGNSNTFKKLIWGLLGTQVLMSAGVLYLIIS